VFEFSKLLLKKCNVNDRDGVTDMTMLMFACKSGGLDANDQNASQLVKYLIDLGNK
jgi:CAP-Gly domain-containing linker protein 3/4